MFFESPGEKKKMLRLRSEVFDHGLVAAVEDELPIPIISLDEAEALQRQFHDKDVTNVLFKALCHEKNPMLGQYMLFLVVQKYRRAWVSDAHWPECVEEEHQGSSPRSLILQNQSGENESRWQFVKGHLKELLWLLYLCQENTANCSFQHFSCNDMPMEKSSILCLTFLFHMAEEIHVASFSAVEDWITENGTYGENLPDIQGDLESKCPGRTIRSGSKVVVSGVQRSSVLPDKFDGTLVSNLVIHACSHATLYVFQPSKFCRIIGCKSATIVLAPCCGIVTLEHCRDIELIGMTRILTVGNSFDSSIHMHCSEYSPVLFGDIGNLEFGPFNTSYPELLKHLEITGIPVEQDKHLWQHPVYALQSAICSWKLQDPREFYVFRCPSEIPTVNPIEPPQEYREALTSNVDLVQRTISRIEELRSSSDDVETVIHGAFKDWLLKNGQLRQVVDLMTVAKHST